MIRSGEVHDPVEMAQHHLDLERALADRGETLQEHVLLRGGGAALQAFPGELLYLGLLSIFGSFACDHALRSPVGAAEAEQGLGPVGILGIQHERQRSILTMAIGHEPRPHEFAHEVTGPGVGKIEVVHDQDERHGGQVR